MIGILPGNPLGRNLAGTWRTLLFAVAFGLVAGGALAWGLFYVVRQVELAAAVAASQ